VRQPQLVLSFKFRENPLREFGYTVRRKSTITLAVWLLVASSLYYRIYAAILNHVLQTVTVDILVLHKCVC